MSGHSKWATIKHKKAATDAKRGKAFTRIIKRAVMRGTGELEGGQIDEITFEGYGPGGAAVLVSVATDNRNRTVSEIRHCFSKNGGNLGELGSVSWMFERKSEIIIDKEKAGEDQLMTIALDAGA